MLEAVAGMRHRSQMTVAVKSFPAHCGGDTPRLEAACAE